MKQTTPHRANFMFQVVRVYQTRPNATAVDTPKVVGEKNTTVDPLEYN